MRRRRAEAGTRWGRRWDVWLADEDRRLRELAAVFETVELAARLSQEFGGPRTPAAVRRRARLLGVSLGTRHLSLSDIETIFDVDGGTVLRRWVADGYLRVLPRRGAGRARRWEFRETDVQAFIRAHPWLYDWRKMRAGVLRSLAEVVHRAEPWLSLEEAAARGGLSVKQLRRRVEREDLPHARRWHGRAPWGQIVIQAEDLERFLGGQRGTNQGAPRTSARLHRVAARPRAAWAR